MKKMVNFVFLALAAVASAQVVAVTSESRNSPSTKSEQAPAVEKPKINPTDDAEFRWDGLNIRQVLDTQRKRSLKGAATGVQ